MSHKNHIQILILKYERHLQKLKEQKASFGLYTPPYILTEIEDIEAELNKLQVELKDDDKGDDDDLVAQIVELLYEKEFVGVSQLLQETSDGVLPIGYTNLLKALALLADRSFNAIHPSEREKVEKYLISARNEMANELIPLILLAILEIDYYNYHGQRSLNNVSPTDVAQKTRMKSLTEADIRLLGLMQASRGARNKLGLNLK